MLVTIPALPADHTPSIQIQSPARSASNMVNGKLIEKSFSFCTDVASGPGRDNQPYAESADNSFSPVQREIQRLVGDKPPYELISKLKKYSSKVITPPKHGIVELDYAPSQHWEYKPQRGYEGPDQAEFLVEVKGRTFKVTVNFWSMLLVPDGRKDLICKTQKFESQLHIAPES
ncbi:hypothetical protein RF679_18605 [Undibacterium cyanobacteriorum]|uniref:Uncharacterized protein n=1 Tax=Undibacterium cyanobacteriorum TaxID=3073561 RepID=A0ABY9RHC1_9BURK|nr:hypothetical protein [Undibacterium sp. 20NA77.5]WMW80628.1 hypothetical protein RF679_18605 [Undibacterium sp. 20NA77.5]